MTTMENVPMRHTCPKDKSHEGYAPISIKIISLSPKFPFIRHNRYRMCAHNDHSRNVRHCYPAHDDCSAENGRA